MRQGIDLLTLNLNSKKAVSKIVDRLTADGLQVIRSFDLQTVRTAHVDCICPHHGKDECNCQLVVLLVYDQKGTMLTLVVHGKDDKTHFALTKPAEGAQETILKDKIFQALAMIGFESTRRVIV